MRQALEIQLAVQGGQICKSQMKFPNLLWYTDEKIIEKYYSIPCVIPPVGSGEGCMYAALPLPCEDREAVSMDPRFKYFELQKNIIFFKLFSYQKKGQITKLFSSWLYGLRMSFYLYKQRTKSKWGVQLSTFCSLTQDDVSCNWIVKMIGLLARGSSKQESKQ